MKSQEQYETACENGLINANEIYLTPDELDLSIYATREELNMKQDIINSPADIGASITFLKDLELNGSTSVNKEWQIGINKWAVSNILESDTPFIGIRYSGVDADDEAYDKAMTKIRWIRTGDGYVEAYATDLIDISIPIQIKVVR